MSGSYHHQKKYRKQLFTQPVQDDCTRCRRCLYVKPSESFIVEGGVSRNCADCREFMRSYMKGRRSELTPEQKAMALANEKLIREQHKREIIAHYGGRCECCGEAEIDFLCIDHRVAIGQKARKANGEWGNKFYLSIIKRGFPNHLRVLCFNCNWSCHLNGGICAHQIEPQMHPVDQLLRTTPVQGTVQ